MINKELFNPQSIAVIGGSDDITKPGGNLLRNLKDGKFKGKLFVINPKTTGNIQEIPAFKDVSKLPPVDLAILSVQPEFCLEYIKKLISEKGTKAFIIISAGFGEVNEMGKLIENEILKIINQNNCTLIGPNCIGVSTRNFSGVFTGSLPEYSDQGCDLISGSGAMAVFIMEQGLLHGLKFANVFTVGNAVQIMVEDLLEYLDLTFNRQTDPRVKLLYLESINDPQKFLFHSKSLIRKGAKIIAIKSGTTESGKRAAASHTGAIASTDLAVDCLFKTAGIIRCFNRSELIFAAGIFLEKPLPGKRIAIITHAGGPGVLLADSLSKNGFNLPTEDAEECKHLREKLLPGSSAVNPFDILATGKKHELEIVLDHCIDSDQYDAIIVILGSPGLNDETSMFDLVADKKSKTIKPVYLVIPSPLNAKYEIEHYIKSGNSYFSDEVVLSNLLKSAWAYQIEEIPKVISESTRIQQPGKARKILESAGKGFVSYENAIGLLQAAGIEIPVQKIINSRNSLEAAIDEMVFPMVLKGLGNLHKTENSSVFLNLNSRETILQAYDNILNNTGKQDVLLQHMYPGFELFLGIIFEKGYGHILLVGQGGIYVEINRDISYGLIPLTPGTCTSMIKDLKCYPVISGARGIKPVDESKLVDFMMRISGLILGVPEIIEMDINPLISSNGNLYPVDVRIKTGF
jgi:acyl-CoA synthetase (NDP forming)